MSRNDHESIYDAGAGVWLCCRYCNSQWQKKQNKLRIQVLKEAKRQREQKPISKWMAK
jgi:hypothetical protein